MVEKITYIESNQCNPYKNLAVEEYLLLHCAKDQCIFYLWQNQNTVVIGRNQNAWKECLVSKLEEEKGYLVRRLSGGGAVYHDLGNLNFTFLVAKDNYDVEKQLRVIILALEKLGVHAEKSGRNDILVDGKKFSGNAFYEKGSHCYHHGTLMIHVNISELSKFLTVSKEKLASKGVSSVKSRVTNLTEFLPELTIDQLKHVLKDAFEEVYGLQAETIAVEDLDAEAIEKGREHFSSWEWIYGKKLEFQQEWGHRFSWGNLTVQMEVSAGIIRDAVIYSDALHTDVILAMPQYLKGIRYAKNDVCSELERFVSKNEMENAMMEEIVAWIRTIEF